MTKHAEIRQLERTIAFEDSKLEILSNCMTVADECSGHWFNVGDPDKLAIETVERTVCYLDLRGLIERHPNHAAWARVRGENEATA